MRAALGYARKGLGKTSPNPAVGAVIVRKARLCSGFYERAGAPHAEVEALTDSRQARPGDTLYVTWSRATTMEEHLLCAGNS